MNREARILVAAALACAALFALLVAAAYGIGPVERFDAKTLRSLWVVAGNGDALLPQVIAHLADPLPLLFFLAAIAAAGLYLGRGERVLAGIAVVGCATVASQLLKALLAHPRIQPLYLSMEDASLPSGHATAAMSLAVAAVLIAPKSLRVPTAALGAFFALAVGISVVLLGWHYPSDVFAGYLVAVGIGLIALAILRVRESEEAGDERAGRSARPAAGLALATLAGAVIAVGSVRADDLAGYARDHTLGMGTAVAIAATAVALVFAVSLAARDSRAPGD